MKNLFKNTEFVFGVTSYRKLPEDVGSEVLLAGSSNAGMGTITFGNINKRNCYIQSASSPSAMTTGYATLLSITGTGKIMISADLL